MCGVGHRGSGPLAGKYGIQQLSLGAVCERALALCAGPLRKRWRRSAELPSATSGAQAAKVPAGLGCDICFVALYLLSGVMELVIRQREAKKEAGNLGDPVGSGQFTEDSATRNSAKGAWRCL